MTAVRYRSPLRFIGMVLLALVSFVGIMSSSQGIASASSDISSVTDIGKGNATAGAIATEINNATQTTIMTYAPDTGIFRFNNGEYAQLSVAEKREYMSDSLGYIKTSGLSVKEKNKLYNFVADQDGTTSAAMRNLKVDSQADLATAASWYQPFSGTVSTILGLLALAVFLFLGISVVVDIAYMVIPFIRVFLSSGDEKKPFMVSTEAYTSIKEAENSSEQGFFKSYMGLYLRRRVGIMILIGIALLYLISGQIFDIVSFIVDALSPLTDQLR